MGNLSSDIEERRIWLLGALEKLQSTKGYCPRTSKSDVITLQTVLAENVKYQSILLFSPAGKIFQRDPSFSGPEFCIFELKLECSKFFEVDAIFLCNSDQNWANVIKNSNFREAVPSDELPRFIVIQSGSFSLQQQPR